jgi:hypothetical protein
MRFYNRQHRHYCGIDRLEVMARISGLSPPGFTEIPLASVATEGRSGRLIEPRLAAPYRGSHATKMLVSTLSSPTSRADHRTKRRRY